jgi:tetratricopeptide (TPR) repeat protein
VIWIAMAALLAQQPETMSLLGEPLFAPSLPKTERRKAEADFAATHAAYEQQPNDPAAVLAFARATLAVGHVGDALEVLTRALEQKHDDASLLAERGHGFIVIRKFAIAERDLRKAAPTVPEARCTLAFALYLQAQFAPSREAYKACAEPGVFATLADRRASTATAATKPSATVPVEPAIRFPGAAPAPKPRPKVNVKEAAQSIESRYVAAVERLLEGDLDTAREQLKTIVEKHRKNDWMEAGYIAAEADYAKLYKPPRKKRG